LQLAETDQEIAILKGIAVQDVSDRITSMDYYTKGMQQTHSPFGRKYFPVVLSSRLLLRGWALMEDEAKSAADEWRRALLERALSEHRKAFAVALANVRFNRQDFHESLTGTQLAIVAAATTAARYDGVRGALRALDDWYALRAELRPNGTFPGKRGQQIALSEYADVEPLSVINVLAYAIARDASLSKERLATARECIHREMASRLLEPQQVQVTAWNARIGAFDFATSRGLAKVRKADIIEVVEAYDWGLAVVERGGSKTLLAADRDGQSQVASRVRECVRLAVE
jgi:hypothetical protein